MRTAVLLLVLVVGCHRDRVTQLVGEVHVHGFPGGAHPAALFVAQPVAAEVVDSDSLLTHPGPHRAGRCDATTSVDPSPAAPETLDGGGVRITGGRGIAAVELVYRGDSGYLPRAPLPHVPLFDGGERLSFEGGGGVVPAFQGTVEAPAPLILTAPARLAVGPEGLEVRWVAGHATEVELVLAVSQAGGGRWTIVRCRADDGAGRFSFPRELLATLPPPPRELQLQISRNQIVRAPTARAGAGVILHASFAGKLDGREP